MNEQEERVRSLAEPILARHDVDLVELQVRKGRTQLVRLVVDRREGIDLETCARVSEEVSRILDAEDPVSGRYTLEVTSPGLDRPLRTADDFRRNAGRPVRVIAEGGQYEGTVEEVEEDRVRLATAKGWASIPLSSIVKAKLVLPW